MTTWPHEHRFEVWGVLNLLCSLVVKRSVVNGANHIPCGLVTKLQEVWKVILAECGIIGLQPTNTLSFSMGVSLRIREVSVKD